MSRASFWVMYEHPADYPDSIVLRRWALVDGQVAPTLEATRVDTIEEARVLMLDMNLVRLPRARHDSPNILEIWL